MGGITYQTDSILKDNHEIIINANIISSNEVHELSWGVF